MTIKLLKWFAYICLHVSGRFSPRCLCSGRPSIATARRKQTHPSAKAFFSSQIGTDDNGEYLHEFHTFLKRFGLWPNRSPGLHLSRMKIFTKLKISASNDEFTRRWTRLQHAESKVVNRWYFTVVVKSPAGLACKRRLGIVNAESSS